VSNTARIYEFQPSFILGFHGCEEALGKAVLAGDKELKPSEADYDWLGSGIYFWEGSYARALEWAQERKCVNPFVLGAVIDLRHCLDLFDSGFRHAVKHAHDFLLTKSKRLGTEIPLNEGPTPDHAKRKLDCAVLNLLLSEQDKKADTPNSDEVSFDTVRGPFLEGEPIYPGAGFRSQTHIQISVRHPEVCVKGYFKPLGIKPA
jgi:hypothetical protein